jgi:hypothetical protein
VRQARGDPSRQAAGVSPRYRQSSWALLSLVDDANLREHIERELAGEEARVLNERADTLEAAMLKALRDAFAVSLQAPIKDIAERFNRDVEPELGQAMSNKWVSGFIRRKFGIGSVRVGGNYVVPPSARAKVLTLAARFGVHDAA